MLVLIAGLAVAFFSGYFSAPLVKSSAQKSAEDEIVVGKIPERLPAWRIWLWYRERGGPWPGSDYVVLFHDVRSRKKPDVADFRTDTVFLFDRIFTPVAVYRWELTDPGYPPYSGFEEERELDEPNKKTKPQ